MKRRIEVKESQTAEIICACRVISYYEKCPYLKSDDYVAPQIIPALKRWIVKSKFFKNLFLGKSAPGSYEYVVARTKYIDSIFHDLDESFKQVLILGAGFDSRALRFQAELAGTIIYEVDALATQEAKVKQYEKVHITIPKNLKFVAIDFEKEDLGKKMIDVGFRVGFKNLFLLEGLIMYLDTPSVDSIFSLIGEQAAEESLVVFDYVYAPVIRGEKEYYGGRELAKQVAKAAEPWTFGIEDGQLDSFLSKYGLAVVDYADAPALERRFLTDKTNHLYGQINASHCLVTARKL